MFSEDLVPEMPGFFVVFYLIYMLFTMGISIASYVLQSLGFYTIAKRRGIHKPWLSWIPVGSVWILGSISDQYQYVVKGKVKNKRKALLILDILMTVGAIALMVLHIAVIVGMIGGMVGSDGLEPGVVGALVGIIPLALVISGLSIAAVVIQYIALYDLFTSCEPKNNVLYLLLSILVGITLPILVFLCRYKDLGMPPRRTEPGFIPEQPQAESWEQEDSQKEPWEVPTEE